ncbi:MAG: 30S ribosomal protein S16 [Candidatus Marinimicrobia bacterium]|nr:30S ribosomal protein S16 [Candidatus Neomarinimicrobiota bacterium]
MSVRIRLTRMGRRNRPFYRVVIADSRSRRDGSFIEQIGTYDPIKLDKNFTINEDRVFHWLKVGALPSDTVKRLLSKEGIMLKWHLESSNLTEDKKKQELQKWEMAKENKEKAKADKKAAKKVEKVEEVEEVEKAAPVEEAAPAEEKADEPVEAVEKIVAEVPVKEETAPVEEVVVAPAEEKTEEVVEEVVEASPAAEEVKEDVAEEAAPVEEAVAEEVELPETKEDTPKAE